MHAVGCQDMRYTVCQDIRYTSPFWFSVLAGLVGSPEGDRRALPKSRGSTSERVDCCCRSISRMASSPASSARNSTNPGVTDVLTQPVTHVMKPNSMLCPLQHGHPSQPPPRPFPNCPRCYPVIPSVATDLLLFFLSDRSLWRALSGQDVSLNFYLRRESRPIQMC
jgi:hypothetical protein